MIFLRVEQGQYRFAVGINHRNPAAGVDRRCLSAFLKLQMIGRETGTGKQAEVVEGWESQVVEFPEKMTVDLIGYCLDYQEG